jgi:hypothetical protein
MELIKNIEKEFNCENLLEKVQVIIKESRYEAEIKFNQFAQYIFDNFNSKIDTSTFDRYLLPKYIPHKNALLEASDNPLYGIYRTYKSEDKILGNKIIELFYLRRESIESIDEELKNLKDFLTTIIHSSMIVNYPLLCINTTDDELIKSEIISANVFELKYIEFLKKDIEYLKFNYFFNEDDFFTNYIFKINPVGINLLYKLLKNASLLEEKINFGKFSHLMNPKNEEKVLIKIAGSTFTEKQFGFLLWSLKSYCIKPKKDDFIKLLNDKFIIFSGHDNQKAINANYYKNYIRSYNGEKDNSAGYNPKIEKFLSLIRNM